MGVVKQRLIIFTVQKAQSLREFLWAHKVWTDLDRKKSSAGTQRFCCWAWDKCGFCMQNTLEINASSAQLDNGTVQTSARSGCLCTNGQSALSKTQTMGSAAYPHYIKCRGDIGTTATIRRKNVNIEMNRCHRRVASVVWIFVDVGFAGSNDKACTNDAIRLQPVSQFVHLTNDPPQGPYSRTLLKGP